MFYKMIIIGPENGGNGNSEMKQKFLVAREIV